MFGPAEIQVVSQAVEIAEDVTANHFKISTAQWKHVRYDISTLAEPFMPAARTPMPRC